MYLPAIGLLIIIALTVREISSKWKNRKIILSIASATTIITLMLCTVNQVKYWKDELTLYGHAINVTENNFVMTYNMGSTLQKEKQNDKAEVYYQQALRIKPNSVEALNNMGRILIDREKIKEAENYFNKALTIDPDSWMARKNLAIAGYKKGKLDESIIVLEEVLAAKPEWNDTYYHLGSIYLLKNDPEKTIRYWKKVLENEPQWGDAANNLAWLLATYSNPRFRDPAEAIRIAKIAIEINKQNPGVMDTLAAAYASAGKFDEAIETAQKAMEISINIGQKQLASKLAKRLKLYKAQKPYIQP
jgi:protein O-mannosyl-transferase